LWPVPSRVCPCCDRPGRGNKYFPGTLEYPSRARFHSRNRPLFSSRDWPTRLWEYLCNVQGNDVSTKTLLIFLPIPTVFLI
jgi:hypothetical protein